MATATDRQILEALYEATTALTKALQNSDLRRDSEARALRTKIEEYTQEVNSAVLVLLHAEGKREQAAATQPKVTVTEATPQDPGRVEVTFGTGEQTSRFQFSSGHWKSVRPWILWLAATIASGTVIGKLFQLGAAQ